MTAEIPQNRPEVILPDVQLHIQRPEDDKRFMIRFNAETKLQADAFGWAVDKVLDDAGLRPFHQIQGEGEKKGFIGGNGYECWQNTDYETLAALIPKINEEALEYLRNIQALGEAVE